MTAENQERLPTLQRLVAMFRAAMSQLGKSPTEMDLESWAVLIHASMSGRGRSYHTVDHVFDVNGGADAIGSLAVLFHDTVYCEVDGGLPRGLEQHIGDALTLEGNRVGLGPFDPKQDVLRGLVAQLFGYTPGQAVTSGLNELASALLAVRALKSHLDLAELAQVVTCIEATIAFRPPGSEEQLFERLFAADESFQLGLGRDGVERAVARAVKVANRDVGNFAYEDAGAFLSHTWEIIPETNATLRAPAYTLVEYRIAMTKMSGFLGSLTPERVIREFRDTPDRATLEEQRERTAINLARGTRYLREKLLAARVLETLAALTGGDAPVSLFMGDLPGEHEHSRLRLETLLAHPSKPTADDVDPEVLRLLLEGRKKESDFDLRTSPLAAHIYSGLGDAKSDHALKMADGWPLLESVPADILIPIARGCAQMAPTRAKLLGEVIARLGG
jgi:hypothetical protein